MTPAPVTVVVPTHNHPRLLPLSVVSISEQTTSDLDIVIIGDGVGDDTRDVVRDLQLNDSRIHFVDRPKTGRTGEPSRHEVVSALKSAAVIYHGDDDLMFPDHVASMLELLAGHDFAHPRPVFVDPTGRLRVGFIDVSKPLWVSTQYPPMNRRIISLTGVAHTTESYRRLPYGWRVTPPGMTTDHYMWQQYLALPGLRAVSGQRATVVRLDSSPREDATAADREAETRRVFDLTRDRAFQDRWDRAVTARARAGLPRTVAIAAMAFTMRARSERTTAVHSRVMDAAWSLMPGSEAVRPTRASAQR